MHIGQGVIFLTLADWVIINIIGEPLKTYGTGKNAGACWSAYFGVLIYI